MGVSDGAKGRAVFGGSTRATPREESVRETMSPYNREEGNSWRFSDAEAQVVFSNMSSYSTWGSGHSLSCGCLCTICSFDGMTRCAVLTLLGPPALALLVANTSSCWLLLTPGIVWLFLPMCLWTVSETRKIAHHWDGTRAIGPRFRASCLGKKAVPRGDTWSAL